MFSELWSDVRYRMRTIFRREVVEAEMNDELRFHLERETEKYIAQGMAPDEARRRATIAFGGVNRTKDDTFDAHGTALFDQFVQDLRYALRGLRARPLFTATVVVTLGLGVGANAAMFGVIDRLMFRPPRFLRDPASVNRVFVTTTEPTGKRIPTSKFGYLDLITFQKTARRETAIAGASFRSLAVGEGENTRVRHAAVMSANAFTMFDAHPVLGRFFTADEDAPPAGQDVVVLGYGFWQSQYGGRDDALGKLLKIGPKRYRVIGVAPEGFTAFDDEEPALYLPLTAYAAGQSPTFYKTYNWTWFDLFVRRAPNVSVMDATADLTHAAVADWNAMRETSPALAPAEKVRPEAIVAPVQTARGPNAGPTAQVAVWIGGVAAVVLLVACANVANLLLARSMRRRREIAVRRALGGSRGRLIRQMLTESFVLSVLGAIAGLVGAQLASRIVMKIFFDATAAHMSVLADSRTLFFALAMTVVVAMLAGIVPALHSGRDDLADSLRGGMREMAHRGSRIRSTLLVFQTALSVILLVGAGLFVRSVKAVDAAPLGFESDPLVYVEMQLRDVKLTGAEETQLTNRLIGEAQTFPGVAAVTPTNSVPFWSFEGHTLITDGMSADSVRKIGHFLTQTGSSDYFKATGTRILRGRGIEAGDRTDAPPVVVVSEAMGKVLWPGADPIGKCIRFRSDTMPCVSVVGVAENVRAQKLTDGAELAYYLPIEQYRTVFGEGLPYLYVRVQGRAENYAEAIRARLQKMMPGSAYVITKPMNEILNPSKRSWTSGATMFSALGGLALGLAAIGLYAVIAFGVAQRMNEIGVRIALGAVPSDVIRLVVGEGVRVTVIGVAIGGVAAWAAGKKIEPLLFGVSGRDPIVLLSVAALLVGVGVLASLIPASRAAGVDPNTALRTE